MNKKIIAMTLSALCFASVLSGCGKNSQQQQAEQQAQQQNDTATMELRQNDYRGSVMRTLSIKDLVLSTMEGMKSNNVKIRSDNPNSFWVTDGYQDFVVDFLTQPLITDCGLFNEEETDWDTIINTLAAVPNGRFAGAEGKFLGTATRNEKDDYSITGLQATAIIDGKTVTGDAEYRLLYDCDKDWTKAYVMLNMNNQYVPKVTGELYEYARVDADTFAVQTSRERLLVKFEPVEEDTDIRNRKVAEFYYSKLVQEGMRTTFEPYVPLAEYDSDTGAYDATNVEKNNAYKNYKVLNEEGDISVRYGVHDSMFLVENPKEQITPEWVFEDKSLQQAICYKDKALVVTTFNKLSEKYERFIYAADNVTDADIVKLGSIVEIKGLVGIQELPEIVVPESKPKETSTEGGANANVTETNANAPEDTTSEGATEGTTGEEPKPTESVSRTAEQEELKKQYDDMRAEAASRQDGDVVQMTT